MKVQAPATTDDPEIVAEILRQAGELRDATGLRLTIAVGDAVASRSHSLCVQTEREIVLFINRASFDLLKARPPSEQSAVDMDQPSVDQVRLKALLDGYERR